MHLREIRSAYIAGTFSLSCNVTPSSRCTVPKCRSARPARGADVVTNFNKETSSTNQLAITLGRTRTICFHICCHACAKPARVAPCVGSPPNGPVEAKANFGVERRELVAQCVAQLIGAPEETGGHFFTIWGARQTGKTWIMRQAIAAIRAKYGDKFIVAKLSMEGLLLDHEGSFIERLDSLASLGRGCFGMYLR